MYDKPRTIPAKNKTSKENMSMFGLKLCIKENNTDEKKRAMYLLNELIKFFRIYPRKRTSSTIATIVKSNIDIINSLKLKLTLKNHTSSK